MIENIGVIDRRKVADDVKALDQETRGALRKHGIRFGQFTIFMPLLLLKPAPTRLRLVLWALAKGSGRVSGKPAAGAGDHSAPAGRRSRGRFDVWVTNLPATARSA